MPKPRKVHYNGAVLFITTSIEAGLLLPATPVIKLFLESIIARAQELYPVKISAFLFEANHLHMLLVVDNPTDVKDFMRYIKTESSHIINRMLGRKKRTIWCEGYDSPILCDFDIALKKLIYIYTNPVKDNLESSIDLYPHLSSWKMLKTGRHRREVPCCLGRDDAPYLGEKVYSHYELKKIAKGLRKKAEKIKGSYEIDPTAWLEAFGIRDKAEQDEVNKRVLDRIRAKEEEFNEARKKAGKSVIGAKLLKSAPLDTQYEPKRRGRRSMFLASEKELRFAFYEGVKHLLDKAREITNEWLRGDFRRSFPLGLYPPSLPRLAEPVRLGYHMAEVL